MNLSIIIVSWNVKEKLRDNLRAIYESQNVNFEIFVVDNAAKDGTVQMKAEEFPQIKLIINKENAGFARVMAASGGGFPQGGFPRFSAACSDAPGHCPQHTFRARRDPYNRPGLATRAPLPRLPRILPQFGGFVSPADVSIVLTRLAFLVRERLFAGPLAACHISTKVMRDHRRTG